MPSLVLVKCPRPIVPPGNACPSGAFAIEIAKSPFDETLKSGPLFIGVKNLTTQTNLVPGVQGGGTEIQVTAQDDRLVGMVLFF
jgi:hypothetical protein